MKKADSIRLAGIVRESIVDGPGIRFTVFCQGCPHACEGCHNPETHDFAGGKDISIERLLEEIDKDKLLAGVTFSGGEPFSQPEPLAYLAAKLKNKGYHVMSYSGYTFEQLYDMSNENNHIRDLLENLDILVDGPFILSERSLELRFRGSKNQRIIDVHKSLDTGKAVVIEI